MDMDEYKNIFFARILASERYKKNKSRICCIRNINLYLFVNVKIQPFGDSKK